MWKNIGRTFNPVMESLLEKMPSSRDLKEEQKSTNQKALCTWAWRQEFASLRNLQAVGGYSEMCTDVGKGRRSWNKVDK